jgi:hypothetical protein
VLLLPSVHRMRYANGSGRARGGQLGFGWGRGGQRRNSSPFDSLLIAADVVRPFRPTLRAATALCEALVAKINMLVSRKHGLYARRTLRNLMEYQTDVEAREESCRAATCCSVQMTEARVSYCCHRLSSCVQVPYRRDQYTTVHYICCCGTYSASQIRLAFGASQLTNKFTFDYWRRGGSRH